MQVTEADIGLNASITCQQFIAPSHKAVTFFVCGVNPCFKAATIVFDIICWPLSFNVVPAQFYLLVYYVRLLHY